MAQPPVFYHILLNDVVITFFSLRNEIKCLLCAVAVAAPCLLSPYKKNQILHEVNVMVVPNNTDVPLRYTFCQLCLNVTPL